MLNLLGSAVKIVPQPANLTRLQYASDGTYNVFKPSVYICIYFFIFFYLQSVLQGHEMEA